MSISLQKGQKVSLSKDNAGLAHVIVGLGWDEVQKPSGGFLKSMFSSEPQAIDCDASAILLKNGKLAHKDDLVYFGNLRHPSGTVIHQGDNLTGAGDGDDEQIVIDLSKVPQDYDRIVIVVTIYQAVKRRQNFGMIENAFIRLVDARTSFGKDARRQRRNYFVGKNERQKLDARNYVCVATRHRAYKRGKTAF